MLNRRKFNLLAGALPFSALKIFKPESGAIKKSLPRVVCTWNNADAGLITFNHLLQNPDSLLDAIEMGINSVEENVNDRSVGDGGMPDNSGKVSLDACIMDHKFNAGSVCFLRDIVHAVSVARKVMERSPHVMLAGSGAYTFAKEQGFKKKCLLTPETRKAYRSWKRKPVFSPEINSERHDTIGMLAINKDAFLSGACSTSGLAFKTAGRVGDSPIIGSGLFVDNEVGAASATGYGELIMKSCSSFLAVEKMKQGFTPENACKYALEVLLKQQNVEGKQAALISTNKNGEIGAYAVQPGFIYTISDADGTRIIESKSLL